MPVTPLLLEETDVVVIGLGVGGEAVAGWLAGAGLSVVGVEKRLVGGECPYYGCIPSKMMVRASDLIAEGHRIRGLAGSAVVRPDWAPVARRIRVEATDDWDDKAAVDRLTAKGMTFIRGGARLSGADTVAVNDTERGCEVTYRARIGIVVATGTAPFVPPLRGLPDTPFWTNQDAVRATEAPRTLAVLGGGAIGLELAQAFSRFGTQATIVEGSERILAVEDREASDLLAEVFQREGAEVRTGVHAQEVAYDGTEFSLTLDDGSVVSAEKLLVATGRRTDLAAIGADTIGVAADARALPVDGQCRVTPGGTSVNIWAVGDITGHGAFTHVAMYQAAIVSRAVLHAAGKGEPGPDAEYHALPRVTFTDPEIGAVGLTEHQAREQGLDVRIGVTDLADSTRGWIHRAEGYIKVIEDRATGTLVGASAAGPSGGEVMGALAVAVHARVPVETLRHMIYAYPTFHRAIGVALGDLH